MFLVIVALSNTPTDDQAAYRFIITKEVKDKTWDKVLGEWAVVGMIGGIILVGIPKVFDYIVFGKKDEKKNDDRDDFNEDEWAI